jgi:hypothetical protein
MRIQEILERIVLAVLLSASAGKWTEIVYAQTEPPSAEATPQSESNTTTVLDPQLGPSFPGMVPGAGGYKVFEPGAIRRMPIRALRASEAASLSIDPMALYRSGYTDAWIHWEPAGFGHYGSHTSDSDLFEQQIWVDGFLRPLSQPSSWWSQCQDHRSGHRATCTTYFWYPVFCRNIYAESFHHFHTDGYADDDFKTSDTATGCGF